MHGGRGGRENQRPRILDRLSSWQKCPGRKMGGDVAGDRQKRARTTRKNCGAPWSAGRAGFQVSRWRGQERKTGAPSDDIERSRSGRVCEDRPRNSTWTCLL